MSQIIWTNKKIRKLIYNKSNIKVLTKGKNSVIVEVYTPKTKNKQNGGKKKDSKPPKWFKEYAEKQEKFNKKIYNKLNSVIKLNNLKTK